MSQGTELLKSLFLESPNFEIVEYRSRSEYPIVTRSKKYRVDKYLDELQSHRPASESLKKVLVFLIQQESMETALLKAVEGLGVFSSTVGDTSSQIAAAKDFLEDNNLQIYVDLLSTDDKKRFFVAREGRFYPAYVHTLFTPIGLPQKSWESLVTICYRDYNPRMAPGPNTLETRHVDNIIEGVVNFNTYVPPLWKEMPTKYKRPDLFIKLIEHLFPKEIERKYIYTWIYTSLVSRCHVYLVLCGRGGIGKSTLSIVLQGLHGESNYATGKKESLKRFNSQILNTTLFWFDELYYSREDENTLKEWQNNKIAIEKKFHDTTQATRIYASMAISNNNPRDNYIPFDARKFAPLVLTEKRLEDSMTPDEIDFLVNKCDADSDRYDPSFLYSVFKYCEENSQPKSFPNMEYKGPMFYYLTHTSMTKWQRDAITIVKGSTKKNSPKIEYWNDHLGFNWDNVFRKNARESDILGLKINKRDWPENSSIMNFFSIFTDSVGDKCFKVSPISGDITNNFYVMPIKDPEIAKGGSYEEKVTEPLEQDEEI
jgi:ABC-type transport system involved in cytochrome c biogenesis ATPase subunit